MIYSQGAYTYLFSALLSLIILFRLQFFFNSYFDKYFSLTLASVIVFHPLTLDALLGPNTVAGPLAFALLLEALIYTKKEDFIRGLFFMCLAAVCNIAYSFLPLFFFIQHRKRIGEYSYCGWVYFLLLSIYLTKHLLLIPHRPDIFLSYFIQNIFAPLTMNIFDFSLFKFSWSSSVFVLLVAFYFFTKLKNKKEIFFFIPFIILPAAGVFFHPWNQKYEFWHEIVFSSSSYYAIVFAIVALLAFSIPKKVFLVWSFFIIGISFLWGSQWKETSALIEISLNNLPLSFSEIISAKRLLAWELLFEKQNERGEALLRGLAKENPANKEILSDLKVLSETKTTK